MYFLAVFFVSIGIFVTSFLTSISGVIGKSQYRIMKQNQNLVGREIVNHIKIGKGDNMNINTIEIDEIGFLEEASENAFPLELAGGVFYYEESLCVIKKINDNFIKTDISISEMDENNIRNTINSMFNYIVDDNNRKYEINMAKEDEEDLYNSEFFNTLETNTVFVISKKDEKVCFAGYHLCFHPDN